MSFQIRSNTAIFSFKLNSASYGAIIGFERITSVRSIAHANVSKLKPNVEYTILINYTSRSFQVMENGRYVNLVQLPEAFDFSYGASGDSWSNKWVVSLGGTGRVKFDSLKYAVNLPDDTVMNYIEDQLYLKNNEIYGINGGLLVKLHNDWNSLSNIEKIALFSSTNHEIPTLAELSALGSFKILDLNEMDYQPEHRITAAPKSQFVLPKNLISIEAFTVIDKVSVSSNISVNANCRVLVTTDLVSYQTYNDINQEWQIVDPANLSDVANLGIDATELKNISRDAWDLLTNGKTSIGFAYLLSIEDAADMCDIDKLDFTVDMKDSWKKAVHETDYDYEYPANNVLWVSLLAGGDYKINYQK